MQLLGLKLRCLLICAAVSTTAGLAETQSHPGQLSYPDSPSALSTFSSSSIFDTGDKLNYPKNLSLRWGQTTAPPPKPPQPPAEKITRVAINPSMVGYIDDAVIASQVRVRFDAALDDKTPDRAEFFYAKCGCYKAAGLDLNSPGPGNGVPKDVNFQQLYLRGEYAHGSRISLFMELPFRWIQAVRYPNQVLLFPSAGGFGDMHLGIKAAPLVIRNGSLTLQFKAMVPTGSASSGLGTNHASIEPSLLYYQRLSERMSVEAEIGDTHPLSSSAGIPPSATVPPVGGFAGDVFFYGVGPSYRFVNNEGFQAAGVLELVGWNVRSGYVTGTTNNPTSTTAGVNIVNLKIGPRLSWHGHQSFYFGYGIALTSSTWYHEIFRTEYRYTF